MEQFIIKKVLNNNVVIAVKSGEKYILVGKAIGYEFNKGEIAPMDRIENIYIKQNPSMAQNYDKILETVDSKIVGICEEIISLCEKELKLRLNEAIHVSLPDHINFAIRRIEKGVAIENPFLSELRVLYHKEYELSAKALHMINERFNINLPEDEIGFICLHLRAALTEQNVTDSLAYTRKVGKIMELISMLLKKEFTKSSLEYARTVTHINFMLERIHSGRTVKNYLLDSIKREMYLEYDYALKIAIKVKELFGISVPDDEIGYIALHLKRLTEL